MQPTTEVTILVALRRSPVRMGVFAVGPLLLAAAQLLNSVFAGLPTTVSLLFAALMACYAVLYSRFHLARLRLRALEALASEPPNGSRRR